MPLAYLISSDVLTDDLPLLRLHVFAARRDRSVNCPETSIHLIAWESEIIPVFFPSFMPPGAPKRDLGTSRRFLTKKPLSLENRGISCNVKGSEFYL